MISILYIPDWFTKRKMIPVQHSGCSRLKIDVFKNIPFATLARASAHVAEPACQCSFPNELSTMCKALKMVREALNYYQQLFA